MKGCARSASGHGTQRDDATLPRRPTGTDGAKLIARTKYSRMDALENKWKEKRKTIKKRQAAMQQKQYSTKKHRESMHMTTHQRQKAHKRHSDTPHTKRRGKRGRRERTATQIHTHTCIHDQGMHSEFIINWMIRNLCVRNQDLVFTLVRKKAEV